MGLMMLVRHSQEDEAGAVGPRKLDISYPTTEFTKQVKMWEKYDEAAMGIVVRHIKRYRRSHCHRDNR